MSFLCRDILISSVLLYCLSAASNSFLMLLSYENIETVKVIDLENKLINSNNNNTCKQSINQYVHDLSTFI
jgi:hypothetical protein